MLRRIRWCVVAIIVVAGGAPGLAQAQVTPPSLEGEDFQGGFFTTFDITRCDPDSGTIVFRSQGPAVGPYPGTFTEEGTATFRSSSDAFGEGYSGPLVEFDVSFRIDSSVGEVTGTKTLISSVDPGGGWCSPLRGLADIHARSLRYEATIVTADGTFRDSGFADAVLAGDEAWTSSCLRPEPCGDLYEFFELSNGVVPAPGKATGAGWLRDGGTNGRLRFSFEARRSEEGLQGRCLVFDGSTETRVKCLDVTSYAQVGDTATWTGTAEVNGSLEQYRIRVQDNGESNQGLDTFSIETETFEVAGTVVHGNVRLHDQP